MIPVLLTSWVLNMSNRLFIDHYFSLKEVGIYSLAFRISSIASIIPAGIFTAFSPIFYRFANDKQQMQKREEIKQLTKTIVYFTALLCFSISLISKEIVIIFFNTTYVEAIQIIPILILSILIVNIGGFYNLMIYQNKKTGVVMTISIFGAVLSLGLNYLLVPTFGMIGAAWASVLTAAFILYFKYIYAKKNYYFHLPIITLLFISGISSILTIIDLNSSFKAIYSLTIKCLIFLVIAVIFIIKNRNISNYFKLNQ
jgi:O-antigen/teichoic acid export membrane protein